MIPAFDGIEFGNGSAQVKLPISPLVGEMSGRTEGGAKGRQRPVHLMTSENWQG